MINKKVQIRNPVVSGFILLITFLPIGLDGDRLENQNFDSKNKYLVYCGVKQLLLSVAVCGVLQKHNSLVGQQVRHSHCAVASAQGVCA